MVAEPGERESRDLLERPGLLEEVPRALDEGDPMRAAQEAAARRLSSSTSGRGCRRSGGSAADTSPGRRRRGRAGPRARRPRYTGALSPPRPQRRRGARRSGEVADRQPARRRLFRPPTPSTASRRPRQEGDVEDQLAPAALRPRTAGRRAASPGLRLERAGDGAVARQRRLLPLPCAKTTRPQARPGTARSAARRASPRSSVSSREGRAPASPTGDPREAREHLLVRDRREVAVPASHPEQLARDRVARDLVGLGLRSATASRDPTGAATTIRAAPRGAAPP